MNRSRVKAERELIDAIRELAFAKAASSNVSDYRQKEVAQDYRNALCEKLVFWANLEIEKLRK